MSGRGEIAFASVSIEDLAIEHSVDVGELTGAASIRVPLPLTTGRAGFGPSLALDYRSTSGNSPFGVGWQLGGVPAIGIDTARRRVSLSLKQLSNAPAGYTARPERAPAFDYDDEDE